MIPDFNHSGVLPPFLPVSDPTKPEGLAPYVTTVSEVASSLIYSDEREEIFRGFLSYREKLKIHGIEWGFQWLGGSFVENCEISRKRPPNDIDIVTFAYRPQGFSKEPKDQNWREFVNNHGELFNPKIVKDQHKCDAYFVDLTFSGKTLVDRVRYWFGLFSHQRETCLWKGILEVDLQDDKETELLDYLNGGA